MLKNETTNPLYSPRIPSDLYTFEMQLANPLYYLSVSDFPRSTAMRVLAKSKGWTKIVVVLPANPPHSIL